ncbi:MAG TPA: hypothetical protein VH857_06505 [Actinomycetes bacterium]|jgi:hypothetical protein|nr:hypothetical protein [Actinomycetes bacterium]
MAGLSGIPGRALALAVCLAATAACAPASGSSTGPARTHRGSGSATSVTVPASGAGGAGAPLGTLSKYADAVDAAHRHGLAVWLEADLVSRWLQGPPSLAAGVARLAELSRHGGVVGVKIADELGEDDGLGSPARVLAFLHDAAAALRPVLPSGVQILVDVVVPELGCAPGESVAAPLRAACVARVRDRWPGATLASVDAVVRSGDVDAVDVSTGLLDGTQYAQWGLTTEQAQRAAWAEIARRGWGGLVTLRARKAMAVPAPYPTAAAAAAVLPTFVDAPIAGGARAVDIWTWRQHYDGTTVGLMSAGLRTNALWDGLLARHARGVALLTHLSPSLLLKGLDADLAQVALVFSGVFLATGTG